MKPVIIVHGGAGVWDTSSDRIEGAIKACREAVLEGQSILLTGGSALDAVELAVRILEDSPELDAGRGCYLNLDGDVEMDALIMDGKSLDLGAVAAVKRVKNPISLARSVMNQSVHSFLVGAGAERFADSIGYQRCEQDELITKQQIELFHHLIANGVEGLPSGERRIDFGDTVGAAAIDELGNLAAGTSTGGTKLKHPGRVGDSPLVGSGAYADNQSAAVSATGQGEALMKVVISKQVCDFILAGQTPKDACEAAIDILKKRVTGQGGLIAIDGQGRVGIAYNTTAMPHAYAIAGRSVKTGY